MFDTIILHVEDARLQSNVLSDVKLISSGNRDWSFTAGYHKNLRVSFGRNGVLIAGSFAKFHHGHNINPLMNGDVPAVLDKLSTALGIDVGRGAVRRVDVGATLLLTQPPVDYLSILADLPRTKRVVHGQETVSFIGRSKRLVFYDKWLEVTNGSGRKFPRDIIQSLPRNLLRYEFQIKGLGQGAKALRASELAHASVFPTLIRRWLDAYSSVSKSSLGVDLPANQSTVKGMVLSLASIGLNQVGGLGRVLDIVARRSTLSPMQRNRLGKQLRLLASMGTDTSKVDVIRELDAAITAAAKAAITGITNAKAMFTINNVGISMSQKGDRHE